MSIKQILVQGTAVGIPVADTITNNGIITALGLEEMVWMGLTYGAWFKIAMLISVILIILVNLAKVAKEVANLITNIRKVWGKGKVAIATEEAYKKNNKLDRRGEIVNVDTTVR